MNEYCDVLYYYNKVTKSAFNFSCMTCEDCFCVKKVYELFSQTLIFMFSF